MSQKEKLAGLISSMELHHWLDSGKPLMLLNVMNEECFSEGYIPGSVRACVYEVTFIDQVRALNADQGASVVVYDTSARNHAALTACEKLGEAGYSHLYQLEGGIEAWKNRGYETGGNATAPETPVLNGVFQLDTTQSLVRWTGRNLLNHHEGTAQFSSGSVEIADGKLVSASFAVDMNSLANADIKDQALNAMLLKHLMDADFFDTARHPEASFKSTHAESIPDATPGSANYKITGDFTLRGQTHPITFAAVAGTNDGKTLGAQTEFDLDRTQWGAIYGSGKFFERLGGHLVNDLIHLHLKIVAHKQA